MPERFKLKEERASGALFDLLLIMPSQQMSVNKILIEDYAKRNNLDITQQFELVVTHAPDNKTDAARSISKLSKRTLLITTC